MNPPRGYDQYGNMMSAGASTTKICRRRTGYQLFAAQVCLYVSTLLLLELLLLLVVVVLGLLLLVLQRFTHIHHFV